MSNLLEVSNLSKKFGDVQAVENVNLSVKKGEIFGFLGKNGAGKSTTLRCILTLIKADAGIIQFEQKNVARHRNYFLQNVGCIIEKPDFYGSMSGLRNLEMGSAYYDHKPDKKRIGDILDLVGLTGSEHRKFKTYSQGMKQRLGIAQALLHDPKLIILDEPTNGLDPIGMVDFRNIIKSLKNDLGKTVVVSSHILSEMELIMDSFIIIDKGKTVVQGSARELLTETDMVVTVESPDARNMAQSFQAGIEGMELTSIQDDTLTFKCSKNQIPILHKAIADTGFRVFGFNARKKLEDLFIQLTDNRTP